MLCLRERTGFCENDVAVASQRKAPENYSDSNSPKKEPAQGPLSPENIRSSLPVLAVAAVSGALLWRLFSFISRYAVNILFWDQWDFYRPLFHNEGLWQMFSWQHGPHRQGIGLIVTAVLANLTHWNSRADAFAAGIVICLALFCALLLKWRLFGSLKVIDVALPLIFLSLLQYEVFVIVPNLSHGVLPVLLIMLYCLGLLIESRRVRYAVMLGLTFFLIYTGFGLFMGPLTTVVLFIDVCRNRRPKRMALLPILAFVLALGLNLSFLVGWHFNPAIPGFDFSASDLLQYPGFISLMLAAFWGWHVSTVGESTAMAGGGFLFATLTSLVVFHGLRLAKEGLYANRTRLVTTVIVTYSLLFCLGTAAGRLPLGLAAAQASRYIPPMIPACLALYFHLLTIRAVTLRRLALFAYLAASISASLPTGIAHVAALKAYTDRVNWKACYLQFEDIAKCNGLTQFRIVGADHDIRENLRYLKERRLNLFLDSPK